MQPTLPLGSSEPDLVLEPVTGWRMWRLERSPSGRIRLCSPTESLVWPAREPVRASCGLQPGKHGVPGERCGCGIYAAASIDRLRVSGVPFGSTGALGTVSMWGRVMEHVAGFRAEHAYPSRLRLVCPRCVARARRGQPELVVRAGDALIPACRRHAADLGSELVAVTPAELQAELLSEYAVDVLPLETLRAALVRARVPEAVRTFTTQARSEAREFARSGAGQLGAALLMLLFLWLGGRVLSTTAPERSTPPIAPTLREAVSPLPVTGDPIRYPLRDPEVGARTGVFPLSFVCGRLYGETVELIADCRRRSDLLGIAVVPPETRRGCEGDGYTRKGAFSVCWLSVPGPPKPHPAVWRLPGVSFDDVFLATSGRGSG